MSISAQRLMDAQTILVTTSDRREAAKDDVTDEEFLARFDDSTLVYDALLERTELILICPSLRNFRAGVEHSVFTDDRTGEVLPHTVRTRLRIDEIHVALAPYTAGVRWEGPLVSAAVGLPQHPRDLFSDRNVLLTMSKNNRPEWILDWMAYYRDRHGADAILLFDNGSTDYHPSDLLSRMAEVEGYRTVVVVNWPRPYGPQGDMFGHGWSSFFLQDGMFELARRGYLPRARAVLNADIDELVVPRGSSTVFDQAVKSRHGVVAYRGLWVRSGVGNQRAVTHRDVTVVEAPRMSIKRKVTPARTFGPMKWAAVPSRIPLNAQWDTHTIRGLPWSRVPSRHFWYAHYRAITDHWKYQRVDDQAVPGSDSHTRQLRRSLDAVRWTQPRASDGRAGRGPLMSDTVEAAPAHGVLHRIGGEDARRHVGDLGWGGVRQLMSLVTNGFMFVVLAREFSPETFGYYSAVIGVASFAGITVNGWVGMVATENIIRDSEDPQRSMDSLSTWIMILAVLALVAVAALAPVILPSVSVWVTLSFCTAFVVGQSALWLAASIVQGLHGYARASKYLFAQQALFLVLLIVIWLTGRLSLLAIAISMMISFVVVGVACMRALSASSGTEFRFGRGRRSDIGRGGLYCASLLADAVEEDLDKPLLVSFGFPQAAGLYSVAFNVVTIGMIPLNAIAGSTHNEFLTHDPDAIGQHVRRSWRATKLALGYSVIAAVGLVALAPVIPLVLGKGYAEAVPITRVMSVLLVLRALNIFPFNGLMGLGRRGARTIVLMITAALVITLNFVLIPMFSWRGAAAASLIGEAVYGALCWFVLIWCQRSHDREVRNRPVAEVSS